MTTHFNQSPGQAEQDLRTARGLIDRAMEWDSTDEGIDYWQEVADCLDALADEAAVASGRTGTQSTGAVASATPPPLHTLGPKVNKPATPMPSLDQLMGKKRQSAFVPAPVTSTKEEMIHIWHNGGAVCGMRDHYSNWPQGHFRVGMDEASKATCRPCTERARGIAIA